MNYKINCLRNLFHFLISRDNFNSLKQVFQKDTEIFINKFLKEVNEKLDNILKNYDFLAERELIEKKENFIAQLSDVFNMILNIKAFCVIKVPSY